MADVQLSTLGSVIKTAYEAEADTNAFTDAEKTKLADITTNAIADIVEDITPQLGGSLDVNGQKIVSAANGNIDIEPNGTGNVLLGNFTLDADQTVGAGQDNYVFTYDNATGLISLEAAAAGSGDFKADGSVDMTGQFRTDVGTFDSDVADGASAIAYSFDTQNTYSTSGAKLLSLKNNGTEKFSIDKDGTTRFFPDDANYTLKIERNVYLPQITGAADGIGFASSLLFSVNKNDNITLSSGSYGRNGAQFSPIGGYDIEFGFRTNWGFDQAVADLKITGAGQYASATTNLDGGNVIITGGAGASASAGDADGGHVYLDGGQGYGTGTHGDVIIGNTRGDLQFANDYTVATLPTGVVGKVARVTDASAPSMGATVAGGGSAAALVWYNGTNWTVIGV